MKTAALACSLLVAAACGAAEPEKKPAAAPPPPIAQLRPRILAVWSHDPESFTQGLLFHQGRLFESTGLYGRSELREVELETGRPITRRPLSADLFGEGLALGPDGFIQLTYREGTALRWTTDFTPRGRFSYEGEGWGLTYDRDRQRFVMSDGSDRLTFRDPKTFATLGSLQVRRGGEPVTNLNELEWVPGTAGGEAELWCNVWLSDTILRIDPSNGAVLAEVDARYLLSPDERERAEVLNGIAFDEGRRVFYLTGKLWPRLFEVVFDRSESGG